MNRKTVLLFLAGIVGFLAVALGASGKHALKEKVGTELYRNFETGLKYHQVHGVALLAVALGSLVVPGEVRSKRLRVSGWLLLSGIVVFSGSLYLLSFTGATRLGGITPFGGILLMLGWLSLCWAATSRDQTS
ncbi:MAG: DUF423 domain-containing protein [Opitutae bacterium]|nr:DUF423 domain-containing protein [Opitutae bacterium]